MKNNIVYNTRSKEDGMMYRDMSIRLSKEGIPSTLDTEQRSVDCVMATEAPINMFDWTRGKMIPEILLMSGVVVPESRQIPLLDTHSRYSTSSVIGSTRDIKIEGDKLIGRDLFSSASEDSWLKTMEGHLTDRSIGYAYDNQDAIYVDEDENAVIDGREFTGPVKVVKKWQVKENSVCPIGADEAAKARADFNILEDKPETKNEDKKMNEKLRKFLEDKGLNRSATEDEAWKFMETLDTPQEPVDVDKLRTEAETAERERVTDIQAMCRDFKLDNLAENLIKENKTVDESRKAVLEAHLDDMAKESTVNFRTPYEVGTDAKEKFRDAAQDSLIIRTGGSIDKPAPGSDELTGHSLKELARESLRVDGHRTGGNSMEMIGRALTTSDFPILLANTANKHLAAGYESADETWKEWVATGSVSDFKAHTLNRASELGDLAEITEDNEYTYGDRTEAKETYQIATYGKMFAISRQTIINDDLSALTDIPALHGESAARKLGDIAYAVLTANAAMGDSDALFHANHSNYVASSSGAAIGIATLGAGMLAMKSQKDLAGLRRLNIKPQFVLAPNAMEGATEGFFATTKFDALDAVDTKMNIYAGDRFTRIYEGRLDDTLTTGWYMLGAKGKTVTMFFLNGVQSPYMETKQGWNVDGVEYKVRIDAGAKAVDWKAMYYNYGA